MSRQAWKSALVVGAVFWGLVAVVATIVALAR